MKLYSCKVRIGGSLYNEVRKSDVTAPEIVILKHMHGDDAVVEIEETGKNKLSQGEERERLIGLYADGLVSHSKAPKTPPEQAFNDLLGRGVLPDDIPGAPKAKPKAKVEAAPEPEPENIEA